jgi:RecB family exonuclease
MIRQGNILRGRDFYARTARRLAEQAADRRSDEEDGDETAGGFRLGAEEIRSAAGMLERLFEISESAASPKGNVPSEPPGDVSPLATVIERLNLRAAARHDEAELTARDLRALDELEGLLAELPHPLPAASEVLEALSAERFAPPRRDGAVDILDVLDARSLRYEHVFCLGLGEGQFPPRYAEGSLISEADRQAWARGGVVLDDRNDLTAREMFLFYLAVSRTDYDLTVSFPQADSSGRVGAAGAFLLALLEPLGGLEAAEKAGIVTRIPPGVMVPPEADLASPRDAFLAAVAGRFHDGYDRRGSAMAWTRSHLGERLARAAAGLFANARRWREGPCDSFDGRIGDENLLACLGEKFGPRSVFSATQLGLFGLCPWRFFATYILELQPPAEPQRRLEAIHRGLFCHKVLFETMRRLRKSPGGPVRIGEVDRASLLEALEAAVADVSAAIESRGLSYPALWRVQRDQMHAQMRDYLLARQQDRLLAAESLHFELAFGEGGSDAASDSPATLPPVTIATDEGEFLLDGRIDRVDWVGLEDLQGLLVVDYKTGRLPSATDIAAGRSLQLPLYSAAAAALLKRPCLGGVFHRIGGGDQPEARYFASFKVARGEVKPNEKYSEANQKAIDLAVRFVEAIRQGRYDLAPSDAKRCGGCPYRGICHYSDSRAPRKQPAQQEAP